MSIVKQFTQCGASSESIVDIRYPSTSPIWDSRSLISDHIAVRCKIVNDLQQLGLIPEGNYASVLDIGCGHGPSTFIWAHLSRLVIGVDISLEHCLQAKLNRDFLGFDNCVICHGTLGSDDYPVVKFASQVFDLVNCYLGVCRAEIISYLPEIARILKPAGRFIWVYPRFWFSSEDISEPELSIMALAQSNCPMWNSISSMGLSQALGNAGLQVVYQGRLASCAVSPVTGCIAFLSGLMTAEEFSQPDKRKPLKKVVGDDLKGETIGLETIIAERL